MPNKIDGHLFKEMFIEGTFAIESKKVKANELNVFPVPDGDTGTNMCLTMQNARAEIEKLSDDITVAKCVDTVANALLRGARGNSGVILSLIFRGIAKKLHDKDSISGRSLAVAFKEGADMAYKAVMKPAEGTILTVARVAAQYVVELCQADNNLSAEIVLDKYLEKANEALEQTQTQNPTLQKAGVVDAGAFGYITIIEGMREGFHGRKVKREAETTVQTADFSNISHEDITFTYCTEFIAIRRDKHRSVTRMRDILAEIGDSIVVVEDDDIVKIHVHTDNPDRALSEGLKFGPLSAIKIENMREQHSAKIVQQAKDKVRTKIIAEPTKKFGIVAVCAGAGICDIFKDLGADMLVEGGQTMNPSTDDILHAVNSTPAEIVFVLPNNKNIIMAAEQASIISTHKKIIVIPSKNIPQGISALLMFEPDGTEEENFEAFSAALKTVRSGQITYAARDSEFDGKKIRKSEFLSLYEGRLCASSKKDTDVMRKLAREMTKKPATFITIIYGENATEEQAQVVADIFKKENEHLEVTILEGNQPIYYFIISVE